jgi:O-glycosyl hydrolase
MRRRRRNLHHQRLFSALALIGCLDIATAHAAVDRSPPQASASSAVSNTPVIDWNIVHQTMDGFGASDAFLDVALTDAQADLYFSASAGIGLSYLRMGIANGGG